MKSTRFNWEAAALGLPKWASAANIYTDVPWDKAGVLRDGGGLLGEDFSYRECWAKAKLSLRTPYHLLGSQNWLELNWTWVQRDPYHTRRLVLLSSLQHWRNKRLEKEGGASQCLRSRSQGFLVSDRSWKLLNLLCVVKGLLPQGKEEINIA